MSKKGKFLIIGGSIIASVAIVTPLSIIANQMISNNSILKLKSVKKNGEVDPNAKYDFSSGYGIFGYINYFFITLTFNHPLSNATVTNVDFSNKYDNNGQAQLIWVSQNKCCFAIYSTWSDTAGSWTGYPPYPVPTKGGVNATTIKAEYNSQHIYIEFNWSFEYQNTCQYINGSNSAYYNSVSAASRVIDGSISWAINPISL